jgi:hypothetical protein
MLGLVALAAVPLAAGSIGMASAPVARCHTAELSGRFGFIQGAAGSRFGPLVLTNRSHLGCTVRGYLGAQLIGRGGRPLHTVVVRDRSRAPRTVRLRPGHSAAATIRWSAIPAGTATCALPRSIRVTPPDETTQLRLRWRSGRVCGGGRINVRPLVAR